MTDTNKQDTNKDTLLNSDNLNKSKTEETKQELEKTRKKEKSASSHSSLIAISLVVSIAAAGTSLWLFYQNQQNNYALNIRQLEQKQDNLNSTLEKQTINQHAFSELKQQFKAIEGSVAESQAEILQQQQNQQQKLLSVEAKINRLSNTTKEDWKLAEAEYLVRLANQRLLLESDGVGAQTLLSNADDILAELEDPLVFDARKAIARDIQALKSISPFDLEGLYLQLNALYEQVESLPQREPSKEWQSSQNMQETNTPEATASHSENRFASALSSVWQAIRSLVVINYNHKPIKVLLPPAEYQELVTGLQLQLDVAQVALVKGESIIYQKALSRVGTSITEHFDTSSQSVIAFLTSLTSLQQVNPKPKFPLPRGSLNAMKDLMKAWNNRNMETERPNTNKDTATENTSNSDTTLSDSSHSEALKQGGDL